MKILLIFLFIFSVEFKVLKTLKNLFSEKKYQIESKINKQF